MMTQNPCINQANKKTNVYFFITWNLLSSPALRIRVNKKYPSLIAQQYTNAALKIDLREWVSPVKNANVVIEMKVKLPVKS